jgi:hypothetical protein
LSVGILGLFLLVGFWPLLSASGASLDAARRNSDIYYGFSVGQQILVHGTIQSVTFYGNYTVVTLTAGDNPHGLDLFVDGDARGVASPGLTIYTTSVLEDQTFVGHYSQFWKVSSPNSIQPAWPVDATFAAVAFVGWVVFVVVTISGRRRHAQA